MGSVLGGIGKAAGKAAKKAGGKAKQAKRSRYCKSLAEACQIEEALT